ncbi:MAG: helix-turn-helix transcriptional regulator [Firmicutes bacterium]|nr:helix-turn-helix transcriptional regulator [Bacillota bacterium]
MDYYEIGQRIRKRRRAAGMSQDQLAEKIGISTTHMSHIETGNTKLSLQVFVELSEALDVRTDELLYDTTPASRSTSIEEILNILEHCDSRQLRVIEDIIKAAKISLDKHI